MLPNLTRPRANDHFINRNGSMKISVITLNTRPILKPTILNGNRMSQINGYSSKRINAKGQQITNKIAQRMMPIKVFMFSVLTG
jgi:hypothetical protein